MQPPPPLPLLSSSTSPTFSSSTITTTTTEFISSPLSERDITCDLSEPDHQLAQSITLSTLASPTTNELHQSESNSNQINITTQLTTTTTTTITSSSSIDTSNTLTNTHNAQSTLSSSTTHPTLPSHSIVSTSSPSTTFVTIAPVIDTFQSAHSPVIINCQPRSELASAQANSDRGASPTFDSSPPMNGLSFSELCCLFCCPPCPGNIAAKLAFLPPESTYSFHRKPEPGELPSPLSSTTSDTQPTSGGSVGSPPTENNPTAGPDAQNHSNVQTRQSAVNASNPTEVNGSKCGAVFTACRPTAAHDDFVPARMELSERAEWQYTSRELRQIEAGWARSSRGNRVACVYVRAVPQPKFVILFSHGNAVDLGQMSSFYLGLGTKINCNVFSYDYSGYGMSGGRPSERNLYADVECAFHTLRTHFNVATEKIILYGQSIGTVPTVDLAAKYDVAAVILHSPLMSGMRVAFPQTKRTWFFDAFPSIDKISKVNSLVLVIHGTDDEVIDISHGVGIYERCARPAEPLWVEGAGHNDVELYSQYLERLKQLITVELAN